MGSSDDRFAGPLELKANLSHSGLKSSAHLSINSSSEALFGRGINEHSLAISCSGHTVNESSRNSVTNTAQRENSASSQNRNTQS